MNTQNFWQMCGLRDYANEAVVEVQLVLPMLKALGYLESDIAPKYAVTFQEGKKGRKHEADFVCFAGPNQDKNTSLLVVEVKASTEALSQAKGQGESYAVSLRAPALLLTNGVQLQVWQMQITRESEKVLDIATSDLAAHQGTIERLLSKQALVSLCQHLGYKSFEAASRNLQHTNQRSGYALPSPKKR